MSYFLRGLDAWSIEPTRASLMHPSDAWMRTFLLLPALVRALCQSCTALRMGVKERYSISRKRWFRSGKQGRLLDRPRTKAEAPAWPRTARLVLLKLCCRISGA